MPIMTLRLWQRHCEYLGPASTVFKGIDVHNRRHIDWRILPLLGLLYSIALIDRTNLGVARITGMDVDLVWKSQLYPRISLTVVIATLYR